MKEERAPFRLHFTEEELDTPELKKAAKKAEKAAGKAEKAQKKLPQKRRLKISVNDAEKTDASASSADGKAPAEAPIVRPEAPAVQNTRKRIADHSARSPAADPTIQKKVIKLSFDEQTKKKPSRMVHPVQKTIRTAGDQFHRQVNKSNEDDNAAVNAALTADNATKTALREGEHAYHAHQLRPYRRAEQAEKELDRANIRYLQKKRESENPTFTSNPYSRWQQKRAIRKEYAAMKAGKSTASGSSAARDAKEATQTVADKAKALIEKIKESPKVFLILALVGMLLTVMSALQSCTPIAQSILESIVIGTYPAEEDAVRAAERAYAAKEKALQDEMNDYARFHPGYDEYHVDADEIWHDPYVLIAIISAYYDGQDWDIDAAYPVIERYFKLQYIVTEDIVTEIRYRKEWQTGRRRVWDAASEQYFWEEYDYEASVPYRYTICNVTLENKNLSHLPVTDMSRRGLGMFALYMATHGNMEGIFRGGHAVPLKDPLIYEIPQETLDADPTFATLIEEANKYVGYPYIWGGDSPETSFDCSGFVSYVFTNTGVYNCGRLGANGLHDACRTVAEPKPGDIVFFEGTLGDDVGGITHCGIYVGNNMMIHCGSPLGYADLNDSYYKQHFHSFGRFPGL